MKKEGVPPLPPSYNDHEIVIVPKGVKEGDEFITAKGMRVKCPKGVSEGDKISVRKATTPKVVGTYLFFRIHLKFLQ